jgi:hypothetical protein
MTSHRVRRRVSRMSVFALFVAALLGAPAHASAATRVYVRVGPPAPVVEAVAAPRPGFVWRPGFYSWNGRAYVWVGGRYVVPPRPRAVWVPGHWVYERRGWFWSAGAWS